MLKTFKKSIALFVALVFVMSLVPFAAMAEAEGEAQLTEAIVNFTNCRDGRSKKGVQSVRVYSGVNYMQCVFRNGSTSTTAANDSLDNEYYAYGQLNLKGYEEILGNKSTELVLDIRGIGAGNYAVMDFRAHAMNEEVEHYVASDTSYAVARKKGLHKVDENGVQIAYRSDATKVASYQSPVVLDDIVGVLEQGKNNSIITVVFSGLSTNSSKIAYGNSNCGLRVKYDPSEINNQEYMDTVLTGIDTWKDLTGEDGVTEAGLPKMYRGLDITWKSSDPDYITDEGVVTQRPEAKDVTLTATFTYKGIDESAEVVTTTKDFVVTVEAETPIEVMVPFTNYAYSRSSASGNANAKNTAFKVQSHSETTNRSILTGGSYEGYTQIDLKGYEEILKNPHTSVQMSLKAGFRFSGSRIYNIAGYLASDRADVYNWETVTWNIADDLGLHQSEGRPVLFEKADDVRKASGTVTVLDANKDALLSVLGESDTNSVVSMHLKQLEWNGPLETDANGKVTETPDSTIICNSADTGLIIKYYESEIDNDAFYADIEETFAWETITADSQNAVVNNLTTYYKGADIVWSSAEGYVTSSGELAIPSDSAMVDDTITANVSYNGNTFTREFTVKLCDGSLAVGTPSLIVDGGVATGSVEVTNATGADVEYQLYIAVYSDKELVDLVPVKLTAGKGSVATETVTADVADGNTVKFLVWEYGKTTPATVAVEK